MDLNGVFGSFLTRLCAASVCLYSYGRTSFCSPRQWRASILTSRQPCRLHSSSNNRFSRSNKSSRWPSQLSPSKSSCRPSNSKVSQQWHSGKNISEQVQQPVNAFLGTKNVACSFELFAELAQETMNAYWSCAFFVHFMKNMRNWPENVCLRSSPAASHCSGI